MRAKRKAAAAYPIWKRHKKRPLRKRPSPVKLMKLMPRKIMPPPDTGRKTQVPDTVKKLMPSPDTERKARVPDTGRKITPPPDTERNIRTKGKVRKASISPKNSLLPNRNRLFRRARKWICPNGVPMLTRPLPKPFSARPKRKKTAALIMMKTGGTVMPPRLPNKRNILIPKAKLITIRMRKVTKAAIIMAAKAFTDTSPPFTADIIIRAKTDSSIIMIRRRMRTPKLPFPRTDIMPMRTAIRIIWMKTGLPSITIRTASKHIPTKTAIPTIWMKTATLFTMIRIMSGHIPMMKATIITWMKTETPFTMIPLLRNSLRLPMLPT